MGFIKKIKKSANIKSHWGNKHSIDRGMVGLPSGMDALEDYFGISGARAAKDAAKAQEELARQALAEQQRQFDITYNQQKPFYEAGAAMLDPLAEGATAEGYANALDQLIGQSQISDIRNQRIAQEMGNIGRNLSGLGNLDIEEAMAIENMLNQRKQSLAGRGLTAGTTTAGYGQAKANAISNLLGDIGSARSAGVLGSQAAKTQGSQNAVNLIAGLSDYFGSRPSSGASFNDSSGSGYFKEGGGMSIFK